MREKKIEEIERRGLTCSLSRERISSLCEMQEEVHKLEMCKEEKKWRKENEG